VNKVGRKKKAIKESKIGEILIPSKPPPAKKSCLSIFLKILYLNISESYILNKIF